MKPCIRPLVFSAAILVFGLSRARAASIVGSFDWDTADDRQGWTSDEDWVTLSNPGTGGVDGGYLNIHLHDAAGLPPDWFALAKVDASRLFAGTWQSSMWVEFDFWANDVQPGAVQVRWAGESGKEWSNTVFDSGTSAMRTQTWSRLTSARFESYEDWGYGSGLQEQFASDLASIDWIGVYIWRNSSEAQDYGLDNFNLMVPEPAEWVLILAAVAATALAVRNRRPGAAPARAAHSTG